MALHKRSPLAYIWYNALHKPSPPQGALNGGCTRVELASIRGMLFTVSVCLQPQQSGNGCVLIPDLRSGKAHLALQVPLATSNNFFFYGLEQETLEAVVLELN